MVFRVIFSDHMKRNNKLNICLTNKTAKIHVGETINAGKNHRFHSVVEKKFNSVYKNSHKSINPHFSSS